MAKQFEFKKVKGWGGKRRGAGRPNRTGEVSHSKREEVNFKKPLHITLKLKRGIPGLRTKQALTDFRKAVTEAKRFNFHVIHYSIQRDHVHFIAEAKDSDSLARGMSSLSGRFGRVIRKTAGGVGKVFNGRFHMNVLGNPTKMKRALEYVLLNTSKHMKLVEHFDEFSSGPAFKQWRTLLGRRLNGLIEEQLTYLSWHFRELSEPRSWLCTVGWMRAH